MIEMIGADRDEKRNDVLQLRGIRMILLLAIFICINAFCTDDPNRCLEKALHRHAMSDYQTKLVWWCTNLCGGIGDRLRGAVLSFYMAMATRRQFSIWMPTPVPMNEIFAPAQYNWIESEEPRCDKTIAAIDSEAGLSLKSTSDFVDVLGNDSIVCFKTNAYNIQYIVQTRPDLFGNIQNADRVLYFGVAFRFLFIPTHTMWRRIEALRTMAQLPVFECFACPSVGEDAWIGIHFRTGNGATWNDPERDSLSLTFNISECVEKIVPQISGIRMYVASDNYYAKKVLIAQLSRRGGKPISAELAIAHVDRTDSHQTGHFDTWAEFLLLTHASLLIASQSGFSYWASAASVTASLPVQRLVEWRNCEADIFGETRKKPSVL